MIMERRIRTGRRIAKISVLVIFALAFLTSPTWGQTGTISGEVVDADGEPFAGVVVRLQNEDGSSAEKATTSDATGSFSIPGVAAGTYMVVATSDGFQPASQTIEMTASGEVAVDFEMSPTFHDRLIVSAQRVDEDILDVPMTISAFDSQSLTELQIQNPIDLQDMTPGLQFGDETIQDGQGTVIRGIGTRMAAASHADLGVATYVDGAYTLGAYGVAPGGGFDLKRIEVARGPQGTLHGRNSVAGSINLITIKPEDRWDATFMAEVTDVSQQRFNAAIGGPIAGPLSFRLTAGIHTGDGRQENIGLAGDLDMPDQTFWAPQLRITTKRFDMNMRWSHVEDNGLSRQMVQLTNVDTTTEFWDEYGYEPNEFYLYETPNPAIAADCPPGTPGHLCGDVYNKVATNFEASNESTSDLGTMYASYQISDNVNIRYNGSYSDVASINWTDGDRTNREGMPNDHTLAHDSGTPGFANYAYRMPFEYQEMSHELTVTGFAGNFNYVGGLFYYENDTSWTIDLHEFNQPWRFMTADAYAQSLSPIWGYIPVTGCQDVLTDIIAGTYGYNIDPERADEFEGLYFYCPEGSNHTNTLSWFTRATSDTKAVFASGNYRFNANWALSGGVRYTEDTKEQLTEDAGGYQLTEFGSLVGITFQEGEGYGQPATWSRPIGHLALEYSTDSGQLIYGRVSSGFRSGGFNVTDVPGVVPALIAEETLINYEVGTKGAFLNSRLQIAAGAWYYDFQDYQIAATMEQPPGVDVPVSIFSDTPLLEYTANIPDTKVWGLDLEFSTYIGDHWTLRGFYAYQDSEIGEHTSVLVGDPNATYGEHEYLDYYSGEMVTGLYPLPTDQTGNSLPMQPKNKAALTGGWSIPLGRSGGDLQLFATYSFTDEQYIDIGNLDYWKLPSYDRWDASISWTPGGGNWTVALFGKNLADDVAIIEMVPGGLGGYALGYLSSPREIGLQLFWRPFN
jgi:iron complex outermembrane receptor protein